MIWSPLLIFDLKFIQRSIIFSFSFFGGGLIDPAATVIAFYVMHFWLSRVKQWNSKLPFSSNQVSPFDLLTIICIYQLHNNIAEIHFLFHILGLKIQRISFGCIENSKRRKSDIFVYHEWWIVRLSSFWSW